jgi:hypothetical protein
MTPVTEKLRLAHYVMIGLECSAPLAKYREKLRASKFLCCSSVHLNFEGCPH